MLGEQFHGNLDCKSVWHCLLTEAEYMAATEVCKELLWLKMFLQELGFKQQRYVVLCDNQSAIHLAKNSMFHKRTKHIDIRYHWIRDAIEDGMFELNKVHTDDNASDMLKILGYRVYVHHRISNRFAPRSLPAILVGYPTTQKCYIIYEQNNHK
ncbi:hypothetical protein Tco_1558354 [Tanacetum coccineum]